MLIHVEILSYNINETSIKKFNAQLTEKEKENNGFDEPYVINRGRRTLLIGPCFYNPYLFIWDFITKDLVKKIQTASGISDICLWNNHYAFAGLVHSKEVNFI